VSEVQLWRWKDFDRPKSVQARETVPRERETVSSLFLSASLSQAPFAFSIGYKLSEEMVTLSPRPICVF